MAADRRVPKVLIQSRTVSLIMAEFLFEERLVCTIGLALQQVFFLCTIDVPNQL